MNNLPQLDERARTDSNSARNNMSLKKLKEYLHRQNSNYLCRHPEVCIFNQHLNTPVNSEFFLNVNSNRQQVIDTCVIRAEHFARGKEICKLPQVVITCGRVGVKLLEIFRVMDNVFLRAIVRVLLHEMINKQPENIYEFSAALFNCNNSPLLVTKINQQLKLINKNLEQSRWSQYDAEMFFSEAGSTHSLLSSTSLDRDVDNMLRYAMLMRDRKT